MKKTATALVLFTIVFAACGRGQFAKDFGVLFDETTQNLNAASSALQSAKDAKAAAAGLNKVYETLLNIRTKGAELEKKYDMKASGEMPPELQAKRDAFQAAVKNVFSQESQSVIEKYAKAPEVIEIFQKIHGLERP